MPDRWRASLAEDTPTQGLHAVSLLRGIEETRTPFWRHEAERQVVHVEPNVTPVVILGPNTVLADWLGEALGTGESLRLQREEALATGPAEAEFILEATDHTSRLARILPVDEEADDRVERWLRAREGRAASTTRLSRRR